MSESRINSAISDASGVLVTGRMRSQINSVIQFVRHANDAVSLTQVVEEALSAISTLMQRMRALAVQGANGSSAKTDLVKLDAQYSAIKADITRIAQQTRFNGEDILNTKAGVQSFQMGATAADINTVTTTSALAYGSALGQLTSSTAAAGEIAAIDAALAVVATDRRVVGAAQNTIQFTIQNLKNKQGIGSAPPSRALNAAFAIKIANRSHDQILQQADIALLAQANQTPQGVLTLLR
jgi:flagellin